MKLHTPPPGPGRPRRKGLTMLEVMMAMVVVFIISTLLTGTLISTAQFAQNIQEYSTGTMMGQSQLQQLLLYIPDQLAASNGNYGGIYANYVYNINVTPFVAPSPDPWMASVDVKVTTPGGRSIDLNAIVRNVDTYGLAVNATTGAVNYVDKPSQTVCQWHPGNTVTSIGALPSGGSPRGYGGNQDCSVLWVADATTSGEVQVNPGPSYGAAGLPSGGGNCGGMERLAGVSCGFDNEGDKGGGPLVYLVDRNNRGVWVDFDPTTGHDWKGLFYPASKGLVNPNTLGEPLSCAVEYNGCVIWLGDMDNLCLRRFDNFGENNWWDPVQYRPPGGMGIPIGVACSQSASLPPAAPATTVYVNDLKNLYTLTAPTVTADLGTDTFSGNAATGTWSPPTPLPAGLVAAGPCALSWDDTHKVLYFNTIAGQLWTYNPILTPPNQFVQIH